MQSLAYAAAKFKPESRDPLSCGSLAALRADNPCDKVYRIALQILKYCIKDKKFGSAWSRGDGSYNLCVASGDEVVGSVDSSWQVHDKNMRSRSTTGIVYS